MSLKILRLKLDLDTENGKYGRDIEFNPEGLNIVRAENTMGKSTLANSILYCLGLDAMLSVKHDVPLTYSLRSKFSDNGKDVDVKKSSIYLMLKNHNGECITIKRAVAGENVNHKIVTVLRGYVFENGQYTSKEEFFIRDPGGASREKGFHYWLESFLGWKLPSVTSFDGKEGKLYLECIFPLFFIEQKAGWMKIQATVPTNYKIKDPRQKAIEFVLKLEKMEYIQKISKLEDELSKIHNKWLSKKQYLESIEKNHGFSSTGIPNTILPEKDKAVLNLHKISLGKYVEINQYLMNLENELATLKGEIELKVENNSRPDTLLEYEKYQLEVRDILTSIDAQEKRREILRYELKNHEERLVDLNTDAHNFKDLIKLKNMGSDNLNIDFDHCPVCEQDITGNIIHSSKRIVFQSLEDNLLFTQAEEKVLAAVVNKMKKEYEVSEHRLKTLHADLKERRVLFDRARNSISSSNINLYKNLMLTLAGLESKITECKVFARQFNEEFNTLVGLQDIYKEIFDQKKLIPKGISVNDKIKLKSLEDILKVYLQKFDFKSIENLDELTLSEVTYHPQVNNIDWYFDLSSSDNIRGIWAYTLAVAKLASINPNVFSGFLVFDEPKQQSARNESFLKFIDELVHLSEIQTIVFTSEPHEIIHELNNAKVKVISLEKGERVIKKL